MIKIPFTNQHVIASVQQKIEKGQHQAAIYELEALTKLYPDAAKLHELLGTAYLKAGRAKMADLALSQAIKSPAGNADLWIKYAENKKRLGEYKKALAGFKAALDIDPTQTGALEGIIDTLTVLGKEDNARSYIKILDKLVETTGQSSMPLAYFHLERGNKGHARQLFTRLLAKNKDDINALRGLCVATDYAPPTTVISKLVAVTESPKTSIEAKGIAFNSLGHISNRKGNIEAAFRCFNQANLYRRQQHSYVLQDDLKTLENIRGLFVRYKAETKKLPRPTASEITPIFIIGMNRSGTSLLEQILDMHSDLQGLGELEATRRWFDQNMSNGFSNPHAIADLREQYLANLENYDISSRFIIDKMPSNFRHVGFLALAFPNAKFIAMQRSKQATIWSNYTRYYNNFAHSYTNDLDDLAAYYDASQNLVDYWSSSLPSRLLKVSYEDLTHEPEAVLENVFHFLNFAFEIGVLDFYRNNRVVRTASVLQVKEPIKKGTNTGWQHYAAFFPQNKTVTNSTPSR